MKWNRFTVEAIIRMLREAEVHLSQGKSLKLVSVSELLVRLYR